VIRSILDRVLWGAEARSAAAAAESVVVHEWLMALGGSDKCARELATVAGADAVFVFALDDDLVERLGFEVPVHTWRLGRWVARVGRLDVFLGAMAVVWGALDLRSAKLVVTSSHCMTNAVRPHDARVLSYCYTPMRYAWNWRLEAGRLPRALRPLMPVVAACLRRIDRRNSRHVTTYVAISEFVSDRIRAAYGSDSAVVYPAVDVEYWAAASREHRAAGGFADAPFVVAGRLVAYKQTAVAVEAATIAGVALVVAGLGPELDRLRSLAGPTVTFVGAPDDVEMRRILASSRALLFPGVEDFGMLPVEAQAAGTPVIARGEGGALETVVDGVTGVLVASDDAAAWADVLRSFDREQFDPASMQAHVARFAVGTFRSRMVDLVIDDSDKARAENAASPEDYR
jgi:glycosyltransferase involved in cell wall biosynthesis